MKIQSMSDVITNSSSELYTVRGVDRWDLEDAFREQLKEWGYVPGDYDCGTFDFSCFTNDDGTVEFGYCVICNVNEDIEEWLKATFGEDCIVDVKY